MNKKFYLITIFCLALVGVFIFFYSIKNTLTTGKILGSSLNSIYSGKTVKLQKPPQKKTDVSNPNILADRIVLLDDNTKYSLYSKNSSEQVPIASITKIMTAVTSFDIYSPNDILTTSKEAAEINGSKVFLKEGEKMKFSDLMYGLLLPSGNDAAKTIAEGKMTEKQFVDLMNKKAQDIGMQNTHFMDVAGLDDTGHSTAYDIAILFSYAIKNTEIMKVVNTAEYTITSVDKAETHELKNSNRLVSSDTPLEGVIGGKTGFTPDAGHSLVCAAQRSGTTLISVVLKTNSNAASASADETRKLLDWGFASFDFSPS